MIQRVLNVLPWKVHDQNYLYNVTQQVFKPSPSCLVSSTYGNTSLNYSKAHLCLLCFSIKAS